MMMMMINLCSLKYVFGSYRTYRIKQKKTNNDNKQMVIDRSTDYVHKYVM